MSDDKIDLKQQLKDYMSGKSQPEYPEFDFTTLAFVHRKFVFDPTYCDVVIDLGRQGKSLAWIAAHFGVSLGQMQNWMARWPEFKEACEVGQTAAQANWEDEGQVNLNTPGFQSSVWSKNMEKRFRDTGWGDSAQKIEHSLADGSRPLSTTEVIAVPRGAFLTEEQARANIQIELPEAEGEPTENA
jgi:hypothetical protein